MKKYLAVLVVFLLATSTVLNALYEADFINKSASNFENTNRETTLKYNYLINKNSSRSLPKPPIDLLINDNQQVAKGTIEEWTNYLDFVINAIREVYPNAQEGNFYHIVQNSNFSFHFWTEDSELLEPLDVLFYIVEDISSMQLNRYVDDADITRGNLPNLVKNLIFNFTGRTVFPTIDFNLPNIPFDSSTSKPSKAGRFFLQANSNSNQIIGQFPITLKKRLDTSKYPSKGINDDWLEYKESIINEINNWYPNSKINVDYEVIDLGNGAWQIKSLPNAFVEVNYNFQIEKPDIQELNLQFQYDVDDSWVTKVFIEDQVLNGIRTLSPHVLINTDYKIDFIPYNYLKRPTRAGKYEVSSNPNSTRIKGEFDLILWKYIKNENYDQIGTTQHGQEVLRDIISEFKKWNPFAVEGTDYVISQQGSQRWNIKSTITSYVVVDFTYQIRNLYDLGQLDRVLKFNYTLNPRLTVDNVYSGIRNLIGSVAPLAIEGTDYILPPRSSFKTKPNGVINGVGWYEVKANENSTYLTGKFTVLIQANLTSGSK